MNRTRAIPAALRRAVLPAMAAGLITLAGCSEASDVASAGEGQTDDSTIDGSTIDDTGEQEAPSSSTASADESATASSAADDLGGVGPLDSDSVHSIAVEFDEAAYEAMIDTYASTEEKEWIEATVTIDGTVYEQVGVRLKGNSSLRGIAGGGGGPMGEGVSAEDPETLPWLIDLDQFVDGQEHDGLTEFVVRSNGNETSLNEAVALELLELAGLASQDAVATSFSVNGSDEILRLVIDNPEDEWMAEELDDSGALYKAEAGGDYSYRGDDPDSYADVFDQEAGKDNADLTPLIEFLQFINESDDAMFEAELGEHLDVDSFATYLAMQELLANFDDIDGPGNNSYLFYDTSSGRFTVVPWDYNLAFGSGPGVGGRGGGFPGGAMPEGEFPQPPEGATGLQGGRGGPGGGSNVLVERFLAVDGWNELYQRKLSELQTELMDSGVASAVLDEWSSIVASSDLVDDAAIASDADRIAEQF